MEGCLPLQMAPTKCQLKKMPGRLHAPSAVFPESLQSVCTPSQDAWREWTLSSFQRPRIPAIADFLKTIRSSIRQHHSQDHVYGCLHPCARLQLSLNILRPMYNLLLSFQQRATSALRMNSLNCCFQKRANRSFQDTRPL